LHDFGFGFLFPLDHVARAFGSPNEKSMQGVETRAS
jgi:hypothetical protein